MRMYTHTCARGEKSRMRVKVSVVIDKEVYEKSHALGVNVSKACENYLKMLNATIEGANNPNKGFLAPDSFTKEAGVHLSKA